MKRFPNLVTDLRSVDVFFGASIPAFMLGTLHSVAMGVVLAFVFSVTMLLLHAFAAVLRLPFWAFYVIGVGFWSVGITALESGSILWHETVSMVAFMLAVPFLCILVTWQARVRINARGVV